MNYLRRQLPVFACLCAVLTSHAAFDAYLKIEGVEGEATDSKHAKWIGIQSFTHGAATPSATTARPAFSDLCFTKFTDKSSPVLEQSCAQGKVFPSATIELVTADANRARFYQIVLSNVVATSVSAMGNANDAAVKTAESVWERANAALATEDFRAQGILGKFAVKAVCTTDDGYGYVIMPLARDH